MLAKALTPRLLYSSIGLFLMLAALFTLSGCLYPGDGEPDASAVIEDHIALVQHAVDQYEQQTGALPIKSGRDAESIYEKYVIDFQKLLERGSIASIPSDAFERGGSYYYVLIRPETDPTVKLMDLGVYRKIGAVEQKVGQYRRDHGDRLPLGAQAAPHFYYVDFKQLGETPEQIQSFYSGMYLSMVLHDSGRVALDYGPEIMQVLQRSSLDSPDPKLDLRTLLLEKSAFVPVKSYPYYWRDGDPQISE